MIQNSWFQVTETQFKSKLIATEKRRDVSVSGGSRGSNHVNKDSLSLLLLPPSLSFPESSHLFLALLFFMSALFSVRPSLSGTRQPPVALDIYSACLVPSGEFVFPRSSSESPKSETLWLGLGHVSTPEPIIWPGDGML